MGRKKGQEAGFDPLGWMFTFSDLVTLLLTFFVMLIAMKAPEIQKLKAAFGIFSGGTEGLLGHEKSGSFQEFQRLMDSINPPEVKDLTSQEQKLAAVLDLPSNTDPNMPNYLQKGVTLSKDPRGTVITLANDLLFPPGSARLSPKGQEAIRKLADFLRYSNEPLAVEGHSDDSPLAKDSPYPDNWALSLARAEAVLRELIGPGKMDPSRLRVGAMGANKPVAVNDTPEHRAMNRRTEIILLARDY
ncbi:MAG: flagellar motor protein MotB [Deltaproteobacteria bacterium]|nr:flagellar motor protein MotB [Deltaproteobacteria bacterium]